MMFLRILKDSLLRQKKRKLILLVSVTLGTSLVGTMLPLALEIGDRIRKELRSYGANILVSPLGDKLPVQIGGLDLSDLRGGEYLREADLEHLRESMFWGNNILGLSPFLPITASVNGEKVTLVGTWFHSIRDVKPYWKVRGSNPSSEDLDGALIGVSLAGRLSVAEGDSLNVVHGRQVKSLVVRGVLEAGGVEDHQIFVQLPIVQSLAGLPGKVKTVLVSALTSPENALYEKYERMKGRLTPEEIERYGCTPYIANIVRELNESISGSLAEPILQIAQTEGKILKKIILLMGLVAIAAVIASSIAVSGGVTAMVMDRRREIGLLKALGADDKGVIALLLSEGLLVGLVGGVAGYLLGGLFSWGIGASVFGHPIGPKLASAPLIVGLACLITLLGSLLPARRVLSIDPAVVLKGV